MKTLRNWHKSGINSWEQYATAGDEIDRETYDYFLNILPPIVLECGFFQVGEPFAMVLDERHQKWRSIYPTFSEDEDNNGRQCYRYLGNCFAHDYRDMTNQIGKQVIQ